MRRTTEIVFAVFLHKDPRQGAPRSCAQAMHSLRTGCSIFIRRRVPLNPALMAAESSPFTHFAFYWRLDMTIVHFEPWRLFNRFLNEGASSSEAANSSDITWLPVVDVHEEAERFVVRADLPGVDPKDVEITAEKGVLTIRGQRHAEKRDNANGYERVERVSGSFLRRFTLPERCV